MAKGAWYCKIEHKELKSFAHKKSVCVIEIICITVGNNQTVKKRDIVCPGRLDVTCMMLYIVT